MLFERDFVGRRFLTLLAESRASAQKGVGILDLISAGLAMSKRVRLSRSAVPLEGEEYAAVVSCSMPESLRKVVKVLLTDSPVYSFPPSVKKNFNFLPDCRSTIASQRLKRARIVLEALLGMK